MCSHPSGTQDILQDLCGSWLFVFVLLQQVVLPSSLYNLKDRNAKSERHSGLHTAARVSIKQGRKMLPRIEKNKE